jgi:hypothetical protein
LCNPIICVLQLYVQFNNARNRTIFPLLKIRTINNIVVVRLNKLWLNKRSANIVPVQWGGRLRYASLHCPGLSTRLTYSDLYYCHNYLWNLLICEIQLFVQFNCAWNPIIHKSNYMCNPIIHKSNYMCNPIICVIQSRV